MAFLDRALPIPYHLVEHGNLTLDGGYEACKRLLERKDTFSAIFCVDDITAIGAMKALREAGYKVPEDISLIGFDCISLGEHVTPALSTIRIDTEAMGAIALKILVARANDPDSPGLTTLIGAQLLQRDTIARPRI
jgi:LacI family transcriptional regulator